VTDMADEIESRQQRTVRAAFIAESEDGKRVVYYIADTPRNPGTVERFAGGLIRISGEFLGGATWDGPMPAPEIEAPDTPTH
jgi:hypothetical protein